MEIHRSTDPQKGETEKTTDYNQLCYFSTVGVAMDFSLNVDLLIFKQHRCCYFRTTVTTMDFKNNIINNKRIKKEPSEAAESSRQTNTQLMLQSHS